jgi:hypothetical protein
MTLSLSLSLYSPLCAGGKRKRAKDGKKKEKEG